MAGRGPAPKDPEKRVRGERSTPVVSRRLRLTKAKAPRLPATMPGDKPWPDETRKWWRRWSAAPQADRFTALEWSYMLDTAVLHGAFWSGDLKVAGELRLRLGKFGTTPEDLQRLHLGYELEDRTVDETVAESLPKGSTARERYGDLRVMPGGQTA